MNVENFKFTPSAITLHTGDNVVVHLTGVSGNHGFAIRELGINVHISEGETTDVTIPTDKPGTYEFFCSVPCGPGHHDMNGTITIL